MLSLEVFRSLRLFSDVLPVLLLSGILLGVSGGSLAWKLGRDPLGWFAICFFAGLVGLIVLICLAPRLGPGVAVALPGRQASPSGVLPEMTFDVLRWDILLSLDPELKAAAKAMQVLSVRHGELLAEKYLLVNDKAYLPAILAQVKAELADAT